MIYSRSQSQYKAKLRLQDTCLWVYQCFSMTPYYVSLILFILNVHLTQSVELHYMKSLTEQNNNLGKQSENERLGQ